MRFRPTLLTLALLASAPLSFADFITGRVINASGNPVAGVNINAIRVSNGNEIDLSNDGTNGNGDFHTTIPADVYDLHFIAPAPPSTTHVALVLRNVVVSGTKNLGTLQLQAGVSLSGHIQTQGAVPVGQVTLTVIDQLTGNQVIQAQQKSDAFGNFNLAVPKNAIELQLDATGVPVATLASRIITLAPTVNTNLGNLVLKPGFRVDGSVVRSLGGTPVSGVDLDFTDTMTGERIFTPNDNSNSLGNYSVVVPAGTYEIEYCPTFASRLVGKSLQAAQPISANVVLGNVALDAGFVLTGTVRSFSGAIQGNSDIDVRDQDTQTKVVTCADNTNAAGVYAVIVPASRLKVSFHPPSFEVALGTDIHKNFVVGGDTTLNGSLPSCPNANNYGSGLAGTGGIVPHLTTSGGAPVVDNGGFALELQGGRGGARAFLMVSLASANQPSLGGTLLVNASVGFPVSFFLDGTPGVAGAGTKQFTGPLAAVVGLDLYAQFFVQDPNAAQGWAFSEGLHFRVCR